MYIEAAADRIKDLPKPGWKVAGLGATQAHPGFDPLDGARAELETIVRLKGKAAGVLDGVMYLDGAFNEERLRRSLTDRYPVLHVASHFRFSPTEEDSFLLLGDGSHLSLADVRKGHFDFKNVDLLTLSACETAMGDEGQGREVDGLAVTAQKQGAKGVLATLWKVADATTAVLMQRMYQLHEAQKLNKAEALRGAQLELMQGRLNVPESGRKRSATSGIDTKPVEQTDLIAYTSDPKRPYAHPYYWAPFILMGNWK